MTIGQLYPLWRETKRASLKPASYSTYVLLAERHILPAVGDKEGMTAEDLRSFQAGLQAKGLRPKTVKDVLGVLMNMLRFGEEKGCLGHAPRRPAAEAAPKADGLEVLTLEQERKLLNSLGKVTSIRDIGLYLALTCGLEASEICALRWQDLDLEHGFVHVIGEDASRSIPLSTEQIRFIGPLAQGHLLHEYVIYGRGRPLEPRYLRAYCKRRLGGVDIKTLRHSFAVRCLESGTDLLAIGRLLGVSSVRALADRYGRYVPTDLRRSMERMMQML